MRASIWLPKFDPAASFVVSRSFRWASREMRPGDPFDKTAVPVRKLRMLYDARLIAMGAAPPAFDPLAELPVAETGGNSGSVAQAIEQPPQMSPEEEADLLKGLERLTLKHVGKGRYAVMRGEERLTPDPLSKEMAERRLAQIAADELAQA